MFDYLKYVSLETIRLRCFHLPQTAVGRLRLEVRGGVYTLSMVRFSRKSYISAILCLNFELSHARMNADSIQLKSCSLIWYLVFVFLLLGIWFGIWF